jgi:hypothetical protein
VIHGQTGQSPRLELITSRLADPLSRLRPGCSTSLTRAYEFASYLYLVILFPTTFVPASLLGMVVTAVGLVWSGWVGGLIDEKRRLAFVRWTLVVQKASTKHLTSVWFTPGLTLVHLRDRS